MFGRRIIVNYYLSITRTFSTSVKLDTSSLVTPKIKQNVLDRFLERRNAFYKDMADGKALDDGLSRKVNEFTNLTTNIESIINKQQQYSLNLLEIESSSIEDKELVTLYNMENYELEKEIESLDYEILKEIYAVYRQKQSLSNKCIDELNMNCQIEILPGVGGEEAGCFAYELTVLYEKIAQYFGYEFEVITEKFSNTSSNSLSEFKANIRKQSEDHSTVNFLPDIPFGPYGVFSIDTGVHRVQRIPFNSNKPQTSAVGICISPLYEIDEDLEIQRAFPKGDFKENIRKYAGNNCGSSAQTLYSSITLFHIPSGINLYVHESQHLEQNRELAYKLVIEKVLETERQERMNRERDHRKSSFGTLDRSAKIRTYNFLMNKLTDERLKNKQDNIFNIPYTYSLSTDIDIDDVVSVMSNVKKVEIYNNILNYLTSCNVVDIDFFSEEIDNQYEHINWSKDRSNIVGNTAVKTRM